MALGYILGTGVMMQLGTYKFGINTAAYQSLERKSEWRWAAQEVFARNPVLQNVGAGADTISLPGVVYPEWRGGLKQVDAMRYIATKGDPLQLTDGRGRNFGRWVILSLNEKQSVFADAGVARKIEFTLELKFFDFPTGSTAKTVPGSSSALNLLGIPAAAVGAVSQTLGLAASVIASAPGIDTLLSAAQSALGDISFPTTGMLNDALGAVTRSVGSVAQIAESAVQAQGILALSSSIPIAVSAAQTIGSFAESGIIQTASSISLLNATASNMGLMPAGSTQAINQAIIAANAANVFARRTANLAASITG